MAYNFIHSAAVFSKRWRNGLDYGVAFNGGRRFKPPGKIRVNGQSLSLDLPKENGTKVAFIELLLDDCYGLRRFPMKDIRRVLDVGANVGLFSIAARQAFPDATIHAYEPDQTSLARLRHNVLPINVSIFPEAVGHEEARLNVVPHVESVQARTIRAAEGVIQQVGIEAALERLGGTCDLLKLDCEGAEWEILRDTKSLRRVSNVVMEYHLWAGDYAADDAKVALIRSGFAIDYVEDGATDFGMIWAHQEEERS